MESLTVTFLQSHNVRFNVEVIKGETFSDVKANLRNRFPELRNEPFELIYNGEILEDTTEAYEIVRLATVIRLRVARRADV